MIALTLEIKENRPFLARVKWPLNSHPNLRRILEEGIVPMSLLRKPKTRKVGSAWGRLWSAFAPAERRSRNERKPRRLMIDAFEERTLLSVSPVQPGDSLVNQGITTTQSTLGAQSVASDHNGDFVVTWTRTEPILDASGNQVYDPATGAPESGSNVYARYFTDSVQRLTLPAGVLNNAGSGSYGHISLTYGGDAVEQIAFTQATGSQSSIGGTFSLWLDADGDGVRDSREVTAKINFVEGNFALQSAPVWSDTLTASVSKTATTLTVNSVAGLTGLSFPFSIFVGNERMLVTGINTATNQLTVTRGAVGTTATAHGAGSMAMIQPPNWSPVNGFPLWDGAITSINPDGTLTVATDPNASNDLNSFTAPFSILAGNEHILVTRAVRNPATGLWTLTVDRATGGTTQGTLAVGQTLVFLDNTAQIQDAIRNLGLDYVASHATSDPNYLAYLALTDVTISAADADHYNINYGAASEVDGVPQVQSRLMPVDQAWNSGFLPAASTSIISEPITISNIPVSPSNPALTAAAIQQAFLSTTTTTQVAPWNAESSQEQPQMPSDLAGATYLTTSVQVSVVPVQTVADPNGTLTFDITFVGAAGDQVQPPLVLTTVTDGTKLTPNPVTIPTPDQDAIILKQPSNEFRVNPEVPYNEFQIQPDNCSGPAVAMDADGSFVITWTAAVSDLASYGSVSDIFARMYQPLGDVQYQDITFSSLAGTYALNTVLNTPNGYVQYQDVAFQTPLVAGTYELQTANGNTTLIDFDPSDWATSASNLQAALATLYPLDMVAVTADQGKNALHVTWYTDSAQALPLLTQASGGTLTGITATTTGLINFDPSNATASAASLQTALGVLYPSGTVVVLPDQFDNNVLHVMFYSARPIPLTQTSGVGTLTVAIAAANPAGTTVDMTNDGIPETYVAGVRPVVTSIPYNDLLPADIQVPGDAYTFRVNTDTANGQAQPTIAVDENGNFVIAWASSTQTLSYFNSIDAQQFTHDGRMIGNQVMVNTEDTDQHLDPYVAMSQDGLWVVVWDHYTGLGNDVQAELYDAQGNVLMQQSTIVATGPISPTPTACFDENLPSDTAVRPGHDFVISWTQARDVDNITQTTPQGQTGVYFREFSLSADNTTVSVIRTDSRANSAIRLTDGLYIGLTPDAYVTEWPNAQGNGQVAMDADGDLTVTYEGFGPDVAQTQAGANLYFTLLGLPENSDLVDDDPNLLMGFPFNPPVLGNSGDDDSTIEEVLIDAQLDWGLTDSQLGRLNAILTQVAAYTRGEANGIMYSQYDADPALGIQNVLYSDQIANAQRDGVNQRDIITIAKDASSGNFIVRVTNANTNVYQDITIAPVFMTVSPTLPPVVDPVATRDAIQNALNACVAELGINWPTPDNGGQQGQLGPVTVRLLNSDASLTESNPVSPGTEAFVRGQSNVVTLDITPRGPTTFLTADITDTDTTINVDATTAAAFPTGSPLMIVIDGEHLLVTAGLGTTTWTVTRGQDGTTAAAHLANANVTLANVTLGQDGWFELEIVDQNASSPLSLNPVDAVTNAIHFDPTDINSLQQVAADIQDELRNMGYLTATCAYQLPTNISVPSEVPPATFLTADITATDTTITVDAATAGRFPTNGPFMIVIDNEDLVVTGGFGTTTWTVVRGGNGTAAAAHLTNAQATLQVPPAQQPATYVFSINFGNIVAPMVLNARYGGTASNPALNASITSVPGTYWNLSGYVGLSTLPADADLQWIYEISFLGEVHDTPITIAPPPGVPTTAWDGLATAHTKEYIAVQTNDVNAQTGTMTLSFQMDDNAPPLIYTTADINFDATSNAALATTAANIQAAVRSIVDTNGDPVFPNALCSFNIGDVTGDLITRAPNGGWYFFTMDFGIDTPPIAQGVGATVTGGSLNTVLTGLQLPNSLALIGSNPLGEPLDPQFGTETGANPGTSQHDASIGMTPDGDYVIAWTQDTLDSTLSGVTNQNIYFRQFNESTDTHGPKVAGLDVPANSYGLMVNPVPGVTELDGTQIDPAPRSTWPTACKTSSSRSTKTCWLSTMRPSPRP